MNFNLVSQLTEEDRTKIENYIYLYGTKSNFIGIDEWLKYWGVNKIKMYKLLGNQFIYRTPFEYNKSQEELETQLANLVDTNPFPNLFRRWLISHEDLFNDSVNSYMSHCCNRYILAKDRKEDDLKFKINEAKKTLQFQKGIKPVRAISRFLTYCKDIVDDIDVIIDAFESFRIAHSMILNDKTVKGNIVISIHPLDFMTMSDNNSNWQSCMSWKNDGCYHAGTIEMMNSNNVLCCYIENSEPFYFSQKSDDFDEDYRWYNKKWRQLVYFTKDIIVSGKPYPYHNDDISKILIEIIRDLAKKNLNWTYSFGPELYKDMQYINSTFSMNRAKRYIHHEDMRKHNILFDTKGMYNDMLNDSDTNYWCIRNKVKHNKVISYSGKAPCLCCGNSIIYKLYDDYDYNERYGNVNAVLCDDCLSDMRCSFCDYTEPHKLHYMVELETGESVRICEDCVKIYVKRCPDCGKAMFITGLYGHWNLFSDEHIEHPKIFIKLKREINEEEFSKSLTLKDKERLDEAFKTIYPIHMCGSCAAKDPRFEKHKVFVGYGWTKREEEFLISKEVQNKKDWKNYFIYNLNPAEIAEGELLTD